MDPESTIQTGLIALFGSGPNYLSPECKPVIESLCRSSTAMEYGAFGQVIQSVGYHT